MIRRFKLTLAYHGAAYHGWQTQANAVTVQASVEAALEKILGVRPTLVGASRTDAGVHALGQVAHFDADTRLELFQLHRALNAHLPSDIKVLSLEATDADFHAQRQAVEKEYAYYFYVSSALYPFWEAYAWHIPVALDIAAMQAALVHLVGTHDFSAFCASDSTAKTFTRQVTSATLASIPEIPFLWNGASPPLYCLNIRGKGFLKFMIRNMMGTLIDVGRGKKTSDDVRHIRESKDRRLAGPTAPAHGLFLKQISYKNKIFPHI